WLIMADNKPAILWSWPQQGAGGTDYLAAMYIGDFFSFHSSDAYNCCAIGRVTSATLDAATNETLDLSGAGNTIVITTTGHYMARGYAQSGISVLFGIHANPFCLNGNASNALGTQTGFCIPNNADSRLIVSRLYVVDPTTVPTVGLRGYLRGMWNFQHLSTGLPRELGFQGVGDLA